MAVDAQYLNSGQAVTTSASDANAIPRLNASGQMVADVSGSFLSTIKQLKLNTLTNTAAALTLGTNYAQVVNTPGAGTAAITVTLPLASNNANVDWLVVNTNTNTTTVALSGADTMNGATNSATITTAYGACLFISTGAAYVKVVLA